MEGPEKAEGYTAEERFAAEEPSAAAVELATREVQHAKEILRYLAEDGSKCVTAPLAPLYSWHAAPCRKQV